MREGQPFRAIGRKLKSLREQANKTLLEVSGAIEIDATTLEAIESGQKQPEEDILALLISHFELKDSESDKLWELAGYKNDPQDAKKPNQFEEQLLKQVMVIMPFDNKASYVDGANIEANKNGLVINFRLGDGPQSIAKIGMSLETAKQLVEQLNEQINQAHMQKTQKLLAPPSID